MKIAATLLAATLALTMVPPASAQSTYELNADYLAQWHPGATEAQIAEIAGMLSARDIVLGANTEATGVAGVNVGEIWGVCQDVSWFFGGGPTPCPAAGAVNTGVPCASIPAHWALFLWTPATPQWRITGGTPGFSPITYAWTTGHLGLTPISALVGTDFKGKGCVFEYRFAPGDELVIGYGNGVGMVI